MTDQNTLRRVFDKRSPHTSMGSVDMVVHGIANQAKSLGLAFLSLLLSWPADAAPTYSELRDAAARKIEKLRTDNASEDEISSVTDKAYKSLEPVLRRILPKVRFSSDFSESHGVSSNLFIAGYAESACVEGAHFTVVRRKDKTTFDIFVTTRGLLADAKARGSSGDLAEIFCTDAAHEVLATTNYPGKTKYPVRILDIIAEAQDDMEGANGLIAEVEAGQTLVYIKEPIPQGHPINVKCAKPRGKQQADCFQSESLTNDLQVKIVALVNGLSL